MIPAVARCLPDRTIIKYSADLKKLADYLDMTRVIALLYPLCTKDIQNHCCHGRELGLVTVGLEVCITVGLYSLNVQTHKHGHFTFSV